MYIVPHLSTGGMPQYLLRTIELLVDTYDIYIVEYEKLSDHYVVQRNKIIDLLGDSFLSLDNDKEVLLSYIEQIQPDIIHLQEVPELFMDDKIAEIVYDHSRRFMIFETSHTVEFNPQKKRFYPDRFVMVSPYQVKQYNIIDIPKEIVEYEVKEQVGEERPYPYIDIMRNCKHILVVGLFTPNKNQGYAFELARYLDKNIKDKIVFDFVGNYAKNFEDYWKPLFEDKPLNCFIHGEKDNVDDYYAHCDAVVFPSNIAECNPLVVKEALSWKKPLFLFNLEYYDNRFANYDDVYFLTGEPVFDAINIRRVVLG